MRQWNVNLSGGQNLGLPLGMTIGGTGASLAATPGAVVWTDANTMEISVAGSSGQYLQSTGATAPIWVTPPAIPFGMTIGGSGTTLTASAGALVWTNSSVMQISTVGTSGQYLQSYGATAPSWINPLITSVPIGMTIGGSGTSLTAVNGGLVWTNATVMQITSAGTSGQYLQSNAASAPTWITPPVGFSIALPLGMTQGGSGTSLTAAAGGVVWTNASVMQVAAAGTSGQLMQSKGTSAPGWISIPLGMTFGGTGSSLAPTAGALVWTNSTSMQVAAAGTSGQIALSQGTSAPTWMATPIGMTFGGTGASFAAVAGAIVFTNATNMAVNAAGTSGQFLQSQGTSTPVWAAPTATASYSIRNVSSSTTLLLTDDFVICTLGGITLTACQGSSMVKGTIIKNASNGASAGVVNVIPSGADTIDGETIQSFGSYTSIGIVSFGSSLISLY